MADKVADLVVIGGGAAGLAASYSARWRGKTVALVNDGPIGGDCTFTGCVPSKALLAAASDGVGFPEAMRRVRAAIDTIAADESAPVLATKGIEVVEGRARFVGERTVEVDGRTLSGEHVLLAAGSRPAFPPIAGLAEAPHLTNENLFEREEAPHHLAIVGGGPIGCEMGQAFAQLGSQVTLIEASPRLLPRDEPDAAVVVRSELEALGVRVLTGAGLMSVAESDGGVDVRFDGVESLTADRLLVATGRAPATDDLGLEAAGVATDERGWVAVDEHLATSARGVWAAGDAVGSLQLTHAAATMAHIAVANAFRAGPARFRKLKWSTHAVPWVTFTTPEVGHVGVGVDAAREIRGARVARLEMSDVDRGIAVGRTNGFVQLIAAPRRGVGNAAGGKLIGATVVGDRAGEMISELALAVRTKMFVGRLAQTSHPYPSWSMAISAAATQFFTHTFTGRSAVPAADL